MALCLQASSDYCWVCQIRNAPNNGDLQFVRLGSGTHASGLHVHAAELWPCLTERVNPLCVAYNLIQRRDWTISNGGS